MKKALPILLLFSACFLFEDEKEDIIEDTINTNIVLQHRAIAVTEIKLNIIPEDSLADFTMELTRNDSTVQTLSIHSDTILKDTGLNPNTSYTYTGYWMDGAERIGESNALTVTTMDTTSHNFTWQIDTLGRYGSVIEDVWVVNENDIWVVGEMAVPDSTSNDGRDYFNVAHWDGITWEKIKIGSGKARFYNIHYFNENDIWIASGVIFHWNGEEWIMYHLWDMGVLNEDQGGPRGGVWGTSSSNLYFAGEKGSIVHFNGNDWTVIESGTDYYIRDIWGVTDDITGESLITMGCGNLIWAPSQLKIIQINKGGNLSYMNDEGISYSIHGIWFDDWPHYIVCGAGVFEYNEDEDMWYEETTHSNVPYTNDVKGTAYNNLFVVGAFGDISHFNGVSWRHYWLRGEMPYYWNGEYLRTYVTESMVVTVGYDGSHGIIVRGTRNE